MKEPRPHPRRIVSAQFTAAAASADQLPPPQGIEIAFAGRSNVGKSSLINALCQRRNLVRTSNTPGCTRQITFFEVKTADGAVFTLVDLPGYGYAKRSKSEKEHWARLIQDYLLGRPTLSVVASLVDIRRGLQPEETQLLELLQTPAHVTRPPLAVLTVATKLDKLPKTQQLAALQKLERDTHTPSIGFSTQLRETAHQLWMRLRGLLESSA